MKHIYTLITCMLTFSVGAFAADTAKPAAQAMDPKKQEMMQAWMQYATPGAPHKIFNQLVGHWKYTSKFWEKADVKPEESSGTSNIKVILGGRFLQNEVKGKSMGMNFQGMGLTGYNNIKEKYETIWIDNMATGMMKGEGTYDDSTQTLKDSGVASCPMTKKKEREYRTEWKIIDKNNTVFTMWGPDEDDNEFKQMEMVLKKAK